MIHSGTHPSGGDSRRHRPGPASLRRRFQQASAGAGIAQATTRASDGRACVLRLAAYTSGVQCGICRNGRFIECGNPNDERTSSVPLALDDDRTVVQLDDLLHDGEPQPGR